MQLQWHTYSLHNRILLHALIFFLSESQRGRDRDAFLDDERKSIRCAIHRFSFPPRNSNVNVNLWRNSLNMDIQTQVGSSNYCIEILRLHFGWTKWKVSVVRYGFSGQTHGDWIFCAWKFSMLSKNKNVLKQLNIIDWLQLFYQRTVISH